MKGRPATSTSALGIFVVMGRRRVASPPARMAAGTSATFMRFLSTREIIQPRNTRNTRKGDTPEGVAFCHFSLFVWFVYFVVPNSLYAASALPAFGTARGRSVSPITRLHHSIGTGNG